MHAHMHICTDVEPPSAPAAPCLASPCLPPSPLNPPLDPLFCLCSHSDPQLQPQPAPPPPHPPSWDCCFISPWANRGFPLCSRPGEHATFSGGLSADSSPPPPPPHRTLSSGGGSYQVATPRPLSSRAFPVGRTRSLTGSVSDGQPYFFSFGFWVCLFFFLRCVRTVNSPETELSSN